jgi:hypothetical protein
MVGSARITAALTVAPGTHAGTDTALGRRAVAPLLAEPWPLGGAAPGPLTFDITALETTSAPCARLALTAARLSIMSHSLPSGSGPCDR